MPAPTITVELDAQYRQLREECGLVDRSDRGRLIFRGAEAAGYLHSQVTNEIEGLAVGEGTYAALLDRKGHMQADMRVVRTAENEVRVDTEAVALEGARRHLEIYKIGRDVEIDDVTETTALLTVEGPGAPAATGIAPHPQNHCEEIVVHGVGCLAIWTLDGVDLSCRLEDVETLRDGLLGAGAASVSAEAAEIIRVESGIPRFGAEMTNRTMPAEAGIVERSVSFTKGCYIGQETVARLHYKGRPNRLLRGLRLSAPAGAGDQITVGSKEVGVIGTAVVSPALGPIALAIVRREAEPGQTVDVGDDGVTAELINPPFRDLSVD